MWIPESSSEKTFIAHALLVTPAVLFSCGVCRCLVLLADAHVDVAFHQPEQS